MKDAKQYYRQIRDIDIGAVARDLLEGRITQEDRRLLQCDCPHHQSQSRRSLHIMLDKQGWYCFGCGVGGDVLQLVEFVQSGQVTRGQSGPMPESHRQARDFLAARVGLPPLSQWGLSAEQIAQAESTAGFHLRVQTALTETARYYHRRLRAHPEALAWLQSHYALSEETIDHLLIGYADNAPWEDEDTGTRVSGPVSWLTQQGGDFTLRELAASGAFSPTNQDGLRPFFASRLIFPYWQGGRVVFLIGRRTPWTPREPWERAKYKKLPVHDESGHEHIAACIDNGVLYNEDVLLTRPEHVIITEGVTDCLALMEAGRPAVSPVTVNIRQADWERLVPRLRDIKTVYICQDNELSGAGLRGALRTAHVLAEQGIDTRLVALPLEEGHRAARDQLAARFGLSRTVSPRDLKEKLAGRPAEELAEAEQLLAAAKVDVNGYFLAGHSAEEFGELLAQAQTPLEHAIGTFPTEVPPREVSRLLEPLLQAVAQLSPLEQGRHLKLLQARVGKETLSLTELRRQVSLLHREQRRRAQEEARLRPPDSDAPEGSCRALIEKVLFETGLAGRPSYPQAAEAAYAWFEEHGARFFRTKAGEPFMFLGNRISWMDSTDHIQSRLHEAVIYDQTGLAKSEQGVKPFFDTLANIAVLRGAMRDQFPWLHTDRARYTIYLSLNNAEQQLVRISPEGVRVVANGGNEDGIILQGAPKMQPVTYHPGVDLDEADRLLEDLFLNNLTCSPQDRLLLLLWVSTVFLMDFAGTRPMLRAEGKGDSGKTCASKLVSSLIYGEEEQKKSTEAANYTDGARNPLVILDNIETKQMTDELLTFMLTSITGIAKEKRKAGSDTETVIERTRCLICTSGIEPLGGELNELLSRCFTITFSLGESSLDFFMETATIQRLQEARDLLLSALFKRTAQVLAMLRDGAQERVMRRLHEALGRHPKRRCNDYLSLMYLMQLAGSEPSAIEEGLQRLHPRFLDLIQSLNETTRETARESNPIATTLSSLFRAYQQAQAADQHGGGLYPGRSSMHAFQERYQVTFTPEGGIEGALARDLFVALRRVAREFGLRFPPTSPYQFAQRLNNDLPALRDAGFEITVHRHRSRVRTYDVRVAGIVGAETGGEMGG